MVRVFLVFTAVASLGCSIPIRIAQARGSSGWLQVDRPRAPQARNYDDRFSQVDLAGVHPGCGALALGAEGPVLVLVHGIKGDGAEFEDALPPIMAAPHAGVFMHRWMPFERLDAISDSLAHGISRLLFCRPGQEVVVLAHSAGGVLVSTAAAKVRLPPNAPDGALKIITVASPLAGTMNRVRKSDGAAESRFLLDLGTRFTSYPAPLAACRRCTCAPRTPPTT